MDRILKAFNNNVLARNNNFNANLNYRYSRAGGEELQISMAIMAFLPDQVKPSTQPNIYYTATMV